MWLYQSFQMTYVIVVMGSLFDLLYVSLVLIYAYVKFCQDQLHLLELKSSDDKSKLVECVKIHQNIRRWEFFFEFNNLWLIFWRLKIHADVHETIGISIRRSHAFWSLYLLYEHFRHYQQGELNFLIFKFI